MPLLTLNELEKSTPLFRGKAGNALCRMLMRLLAIDKVNDLYDRNSVHKGPYFASAVLKDLGIGYEILNPDVLLNLPDGPFITISNHPYGHIDGVMLVDVFGHIKPDFKVMVNNILCRIETLDDNFICVTPSGIERTAPTRASIQGIREAVAHIRNGGCLGLFPAGAVSDLHLKEGRIKDREWQEPVIRLIMKMNVPIVPVHFLDRNSYFYYCLGLIAWKVRLLRLIPEVFNKSGKRTRIALGEIITPAQQRTFNDINSFREYLRKNVYEQQDLLKKKNPSRSVSRGVE